MIFTEAINKPNVHRITGTRHADNKAGTWCLTFSPVARSKDNSGYRQLVELSLVCRAAYAAVRLATQQHHARLPFKSLKAPVDSTEDLVLIDLPNSKSNRLEYFNTRHQFLNPPGMAFNPECLAIQFPDIQKIALNYRDSAPEPHDWKCHFRCTDTVHAPHHVHGAWRMCPDEVCGFLNCFPKLREFYLVLDPGRGAAAKGLTEAYIRNFYTGESHVLL
jgi:hypothetical protein